MCLQRVGSFKCSSSSGCNRMIAFLTKAGRVKRSENLSRRSRTCHEKDLKGAILLLVKKFNFEILISIQTILIISTISKRTFLLLRNFSDLKSTAVTFLSLNGKLSHQNKFIITVVATLFAFFLLWSCGCDTRNVLYVTQWAWVRFPHHSAIFFSFWDNDGRKELGTVN